MLGFPCCIKLEDERLVKVKSEEVLEAGSTLRRRDIALSGTELAPVLMTLNLVRSRHSYCTVLLSVHQLSVCQHRRPCMHAGSYGASASGARWPIGQLGDTR